MKRLLPIFALAALLSGLSLGHHLQLEAIKRYSEACKESKNWLIVQGSAPVLVGGR